ncbi:zinc finger protein 480-like [Mizuhopecten yessoensis]|uniref:Zinc finger protein 596 n=1 Tax=Mizuhopecten yessoensis TaxID=6573 RepID=A0A210Q5H2_MIZYE|nr:zinc finger protein 480-like [Mizuhopecten yessoensis]OWF43993.1 Zinc finger protein 596 [Mizuhopecten yessoensis]
MDKEEMEAYLDFSLMAERNQKQPMNLNQIDKNADDNNLKQNWSEISELSGSVATTRGLDLTSEYLLTKSASNVQYTSEHFLLASEGQGNEETKGSNSGITKMEIGSLFQQVNQEKPLKDGEILSKAVDSSPVFSRQEENVDDRNVNHSPWSYNDEIVVLNLSRGEKTNPTTSSADNIVVQFESDLQSKTEMHLNFIQREQNNFNSSFLCDQKNQKSESDTKPPISQKKILGDLEQGKGDNQTCEGIDNVEGPSCSNMLDQGKGCDSDQHCEIIQNKAASEIKFHADDVAVERSIYVSKESTVAMNGNDLSRPQFDLSNDLSRAQLVTSERDYPVKTPIKVKSPIKMTFKKRKYKVENMCKGENKADTLVQDNKKFCHEKLIETSTSNDSDYDVDHDGLVEENVPLDYSMHATLVRQNLSKSGTTDQASTKQLSDTDANTSDQDQESFCSSLKLVSVSEVEQKKSSGSRLKSENESSTEDEIVESDSKEEETDQKGIGQVDNFVLERLIKNCQEKKKSKVKTTGNSNSKVKVFNCDTCSKTFTRKSTWRHHVKIHVDDKFKECKVCGKKLKFSGNMLSHLKTHTGDRPFKCEFCEKTFTRAASLYTHVRSHTGEKAFLCEICGKGFADKSHYRRHLRIHSGIKPFKCDVCEMAFTQSWSLKSHMLCHAEEKPHICSFCGKGYTQKAYLESHVRSHTGERPYSCETCGKSFSDSSCMRRHAKSHLGERSFVCELCGKAFGRGWNLTVHMRIHYDDKRYECYICGKAFVQKINLDKHILTHPVEPCD